MISKVSQKQAIQNKTIGLETKEIAQTDNYENQNPAHNFSYPSSAAAVVFGVHLSAQAAFRLDRKSPAIRPCV